MDVYIYIYTCQREISGRGTRAATVRVRRADCVCAAARTHPRHSVCTRPCCSAPGKRVRAHIACVRGQGRACGPSATLSLLDPPASPSPLLCSPLVPMRNISLPYHRCRNCSLCLSLPRSFPPPPFRFPLLQAPRSQRWTRDAFGID